MPIHAPAPKPAAEDLAQRIAAANRDYYDGGQAVTDEAYDEMKEQLREVAPDHPLITTAGIAPNPASLLKKATHRIPMGSLDNGFDEKSIADYVTRVFKLLAEAGVAEGPKAFTVQPKMDGFSIDLCYVGGRLTQAITRGDGIEGEDVTANIMKAQGVPHALAERLDVSVRGEVVIHRRDFKEHFPGDANARSSAAGTCRRLDGARAEHLQFYAFNAVLHDGTEFAASEMKSLIRLRALGCRVVESELVDGSTPEAAIQELTFSWATWKGRRELMPFECDGAVVKVSRISKGLLLGVSGACPRSMLAMKWRGSMVATGKVRGLLNSVGRTGAITPVAIFDPVAVGGVTVTRASLANWDEVARLGVGLGAEVTVERAGEVIPKVTAVLKPGASVFQRPEVCPECSKSTTADGPRQLCTNQDCAGRAFRRVYHWVQKRAIMHLGEAAVDQLMSLDGPVQRAADLYTLRTEQLDRACGGATMARKVAASLEASRDVALHDLLGSVGVAGLGSSEALKVCRGLNLGSLADLYTPNGDIRFLEEDLLRVPGFGADKAAKVWHGLVAWAADLLELGQHLRVTPPPADGTRTGPLAGKKFCITGATGLDREVLKKILTEAGGEWKSSVVRGLDFLIMAEADSHTVKAEAARAKGVRTMTETEALDLAGYDR